MQLKTDVENYSHGISKISLTNATNNNKNVRALQTLANAGSTIHDAYIWADCNSELFPNTRKRIQSEKIESIFNNHIDMIFENYLISNDLLTIKAATAEQKTNSSKQDTLVTENMLTTLGKVKKSYLNAAIDEIEKNYSSLENYLISQLGLKHNDIHKIQQIFGN